MLRGSWDRFYLSERGLYEGVSGWKEAILDRERGRLSAWVLQGWGASLSDAT